MQDLTKRGMRLAGEFRSQGLEVIESYPGAAQDILRISRKKTSIEDLNAGIRDLGLKGQFVEDPVNHDELDAVTSALVGYFFLAQSYEGVGTPEEGLLIIPKKLNGNSHGSGPPH
jgi:predicted nuclease with RNAse H fold